LGALTRSLGDIGIDDKFICQVRDEVIPGMSALFALSHGRVVDRLAVRFAELIRTNSSAEDEAKLREAFFQE